MSKNELGKEQEIKVKGKKGKLGKKCRVKIKTNLRFKDSVRGNSCNFLIYIIANITPNVICNLFIVIRL